MIQVNIETTSGKLFKFEIDQAKCVHDLKMIIQNDEGTPANNQCLIFKYAFLDDATKLNECIHENNQTLLLTRKDRSLLLYSSIIFEKSTLIDHIHQSIIDLSTKPNEHYVKNLLIEAFAYLNINLDIETTDELFSLILSIFSQYSQLCSKMLGQFLEQSKLNSNHIIITASFLSFMRHRYTQIPITNYNSFISDALHQILAQIPKSNTNLIIFGFKIPFQFQHRFVIDIVSLVELTEEIVLSLYPYIFQTKITSKTNIDFLIKDMHNSDLLKILPESIFTENNLLMNLSSDTISYIIPYLSEPTFRKSLDIIQTYYDEKRNITNSFAKSIINKCIEFNISIKHKDFLLEKLLPCDLTPELWKFIEKNNILLPKSLVSNIKSFPSSEIALKFASNPKKLPQKVLEEGLLNVTDFSIYSKILETNNIECEVFKKIEFWYHIMSIVSNDVPQQLIDRFLFYFQKYIKPTDFNKIFTDMIFHHYPPSQTESSFLVYIFKNLQKTYRDVYFADMKNTLKRVIANKKVIPPVSLCELFDFKVISSQMRQQKPNPYVLYLYEFSYKKSFSSSYVTSLSILPQETKNDNDLIEFIEKNGDLSLLPKMDQSKLSLIMCSFLYTSNKDNTVVNGLTKETILPFIAISLNYLKLLKGKFLRSSDSIIKMFLEGCMFLSNNESPLLIASIDSIISNIRYFCYEKKWLQNALFQTINILTPMLLKGEYKANKSFLLKSIFNFSCENSNAFIQEKTLLLMNNYGIDLLNFSIDNFSQIKQDVLKGNELNMSLLNTNNMTNLIANNISSKKSKEIAINTMRFINNNCPHAPQVNCNENTIKILHVEIKEKKWENVLEIVEFMKNQKIKLNEGIFAKYQVPMNIHDKIFSNSAQNMKNALNIIEDILKDPKPEENKEIFLSLFNVLMQDKVIAINYFTTQFEKYDSNSKLDPSIIIKKLSNWLQNKKDIFLESLHRSYAYNPNDNCFYKRLNVPKLPQSELGNSIISKLYKVKNYQAFVCLTNIASCFPFLFTSNTRQLIDIVLQVFESNFHVIFESENENEKMISKNTVIAAYTFINSALYSLQVMQTFVFYVFNNINAFTDYQTCAISVLLASLFETKFIQFIIFSLSLKYNFIGIINNLLQKNLKKSQEFINCYKIFLYFLLESYYYVISILYPKGDILNYTSGINYTPMFIDQIKNVEKPFENCFNGNLIFSDYLIASIQNESDVYGCNLMEKIDEFQPFWITYDIENEDTNFSTYEVSQTSIKQLINDFKKIEKSSPFSNVYSPNVSPPFPMTIKMVRYLFSQQRWVYQWILGFKRISTLPEYYVAIQKVVDELKSIKINQKKRNTNQLKNERFLYATHFDIENNLYEMYCQKELFETIIKEAMICMNSGILNILNRFFETSTKNSTVFNSFLDLISQYIDKIIKGDVYTSSKSIINLIDILSVMFKSSFNSNLVGICRNKLFDLMMSPKYRFNISKFFEHYNYMKCDLPKKICHLIGFMFSSNEKIENIHYYMSLLSAIGGEKLKYIMPIVNIIFYYEVRMEKVPYENIIYFINGAPSITRKYINKLYPLVDILIKKYNKEPNIDYLDMIFTFLNYLSPRRNNSKCLKSDEIDFSNSIRFYSEFSSQDDQDFLIKPASQALKNSSPGFWNLYDKNRAFINRLIKNDISNIVKLKFLIEFHELVDFRVRAFYFHSEMNKQLDDTLGYIYRNNLYVHRQNVVNDSFNKLQSLKRKDFMRDITIHFLGENGIDCGGLTNEWFSLVIQELFNPNYNLFKQTKNNSSQPSISSFLNGPQHINYFNFAGKMIALALIKEKFVNAHLTMSFYRQILHQRPKFKDLESYDENIYNSLKWILDNDINSLEMTFTIDVEEFGEHKTIELKENGENILVTNDNKREYVSLYAQYHLQTSIKKQVDSFCSGFDEIIPPKYMKMFSPSELDLLICGIPKIDVMDLKKNTVYEYPYHENHPVVVLFFKVLSKWNNENLAKFLLFLTGSSQVPINGFKAFKDRGNPITISDGGDKTRFPAAHTCFNMLDLPKYNNEKEMNNKLIRAIQEREFGFG